MVYPTVPTTAKAGPRDWLFRDILWSLRQLDNAGLELVAKYAAELARTQINTRFARGKASQEGNYPCE